MQTDALLHAAMLHPLESADPERVWHTSCCSVTSLSQTWRWRGSSEKRRMMVCAPVSWPANSIDRNMSCQQRVEFQN